MTAMPRSGDPSPTGSPRLTGISPELLDDALARAAHHLPVQGPLHAFVFQNPLRAFEGLPFEQGVAEAQRILGGEPYLPEDEYRQAFVSGRITRTDLRQVLEALSDSTSDPLLARGALSRSRLRDLLLRHGLVEVRGPALEWHMQEVGWWRRLREDVPSEARSRLVSRTATWLRGVVEAWDPERIASLLTGEDDPTAAASRLEEIAGLGLDRDELLETLQLDPEPLVAAALWVASRRTTREAIAGDPCPKPVSWRGRRPRDLVLGALGRDVDELVRPHLYRWTALHLDQGVGYWSPEPRDEGFFDSVVRLVRTAPSPPDPWLATVYRELALGPDPRRLALDCLERLGIEADELEVVVRQTLLAHRGWAGMVRTVERDPSLLPFQPCRASLLDFLALALCLETQALSALGSEGFGPGLAPSGLREIAAQRGGMAPEDPDARAFRLLQAASLSGLSAPELLALTPGEAHALLDEIEAFGSLERRRILHAAYEFHYQREILDALAARRRSRIEPPPSPPPRIHLVTCLDDRFEGLRRHFESKSESAETFGAAGFFGLPIWFRGPDDRRASPLCPLGARPTHSVVERPHTDDHPSRDRQRSWFGRLTRATLLESRYLLLGWFSSAVLGLLSGFPLFFRIFAPRFASRLRDRIWRLWRPDVPTALELVPTPDHGPGPAGAGTGSATSVSEGDPDPASMAPRIRDLLRTIGLAGSPAPLVLVLGHESSSVNNLHSSAYQCGACGGRSGAPNARLFATLANHPRIRTWLADHGTPIPERTWFVGGVYDTCADRFELFDLDRVPPGLTELVAQARRDLEEARRAHAQERCRWFAIGREDPSPESSLAEVEARSVDLAQPWPENDHGGNACCVVGRRDLTRGIFLDRRAFLVSYDPEADSDGDLLLGLLSAIVPVVSGINLAYFFGKTDCRIYGSGTKLPHNLSGLMGVVDGPMSDLRTGAWWQTTRIHEPVRLFMVVEATPARLLGVAERSAMIRDMVENRWIRLATVDPGSGDLHVLEPEGFVAYRPDPAPLPVVATWHAWFACRDGFLPPVLLASEVGP